MRTMRTLRALGTVTNLGGEQPLGSIVGALIEVRFTAAAQAARVESRVSVHTGRVGRASQTDDLGISTADVMFAEYWRMSRIGAASLCRATAEGAAVADDR